MLEIGNLESTKENSLKVEHNAKTILDIFKKVSNVFKDWHKNKRWRELDCN